MHGCSVIICSYIIIIIIVIILVITCMQVMYNYIPETNHDTSIQSFSCSVFTVCATSNVISLVKHVLFSVLLHWRYFYIIIIIIIIIATSAIIIVTMVSANLLFCLLLCTDVNLGRSN